MKSVRRELVREGDFDRLPDFFLSLIALTGYLPVMGNRIIIDLLELIEITKLFYGSMFYLAVFAVALDKRKVYPACLIFALLEIHLRLSLRVRKRRTG